MMKITSTIKNTFRLIMDSWTFLQSNKKILIFPLLSLLICAGLSVLFYFPIRNNPTVHATGSVTPVSLLDTVIPYIVFVSWYFVCGFVIIFFNGATLSYVYARIRGSESSLCEAVRLSLSRMKAIFVWSLIASSISLLLNITEKNSDSMCERIREVIGMAWHVLSYLVMPFFVVENIGPIIAIKKSAALLRQTARDQCIADFSLGLIFIIMNLPIVSLLLLLQYTHNIHFIILTVAFVAAFFMISWIFYMTINSIFQINYFLYLKNLPMASTIQPSVMDQLFKTRLRHF